MPSTTKAAADPDAERVRLIRDISTLLEFLGQRADSRLQAHFDDTRADLTAPVRKLAVPPCRSYRHFLNRLIAIEAGKPASPQAAKQLEGDAKLDDLAFLYFSRDFLAAVAAPATVDTIRVTGAYIRARRHSLTWRLSHALRRCWQRWRRGDGTSLPGSAQEDEATAGANRLAFRVVLIEYFAVVLTAATLAISAYAFSGHIILESQRRILSDYDAISRDRVTLIKEIQVAGGAVLDDPLAPPPSCDRAHPERAQSLQDDAHLVRSASLSALAAVIPPASEAVHAAASKLCGIYWRLKRANEDMIGVTLHLVSWTRVAFRWRYIGNVFGVDAPFIVDSAHQHDDWCANLQFPPEPGGHCGRQLQELIYHTGEVADSVLSCIALYLLPTLYGCLGAAAATLRTLRRKVDASLVTMTDRGRVQQDVILGLLCGAIIGLFAGYLGKGTAADGLGLSALALLAGYNVSGMFAFLDELSNRVFRPVPAGHAEARSD